MCASSEGSIMCGELNFMTASCLGRNVFCFSYSAYHAINMSCVLQCCITDDCSFFSLAAIAIKCHSLSSCPTVENRTRVREKVEQKKVKHENDCKTSREGEKVISASLCGFVSLLLFHFVKTFLFSCYFFYLDNKLYRRSAQCFATGM